MINSLISLISFSFLEIIVYGVLIFNQNIHIKKVLDQTLNRDYEEFNIIHDFFYDEINKNNYEKFNNIIILKSVKDIRDYKSFIQKIDTESTFVYEKAYIDFLKNRELFLSLKNQKNQILLFEGVDSYVSCSFIPFYDEKRVLNYYLKFNEQAQIYDLNFRTNILFILLSIMIFILIIYTHILARAKAVIKNKNRDYKKFLDTIDEHILITETDTEGFITNVSSAFCKITGYSKYELIGRPHNIVRHPDTPKEIFIDMWKNLRHGKSWSGEIKNIDKYGNTYWVYGTIVPKFDSKNNLIGYISFRKDITDKKRLDRVNSKLKKKIRKNIDEMKIKDSNLVQQSKMALVGNMVDIIAHQWKQPLSIMSLYAIDISESVKYHEMNQKYADDLSAKFKKQIAHLANTLNEFRTFFSPNKLYDKFNLYENIENTLLLLKDDLINYKIEVLVEGDKEITLFGVSNEFQHIFLNLISNSKDAFNEKDIQNREIKIKFKEENSDVVIDYFDNAGGIKEHIIDKVFDLNFTTKPIGMGSGVGMYVSKMIMGKLGGNISVKNYEDGVNFRLILPNKDRRKYPREEKKADIYQEL